MSNEVFGVDYAHNVQFYARKAEKYIESNDCSSDNPWIDNGSRSKVNSRPEKREEAKKPANSSLYGLPSIGRVQFQGLDSVIYRVAPRKMDPMDEITGPMHPTAKAQPVITHSRAWRHDWITVADVQTFPKAQAALDGVNEEWPK